MSEEHDIGIAERHNVKLRARTDKMSENAAQLEIRVTEDSMKLLLSCTIPEDNVDALAKDIIDEMAELGVKGQSAPDQLTLWLKVKAKKSPILKDEILIEGQHPQPPVEGKIEWGADFFKEGFCIDEESGAIDYRKKTAQSTVEKGQFLAHLIKPIPGKDGKNIRGKRVPAQQPKKVRLRPGKNVSHDEEKDMFYAESTGRIKLSEHILSIDEILHINGNVGLESGDIKHTGTIIIEGDAQEGATIETTGDVEIKGLVEPCDISIGGNLTVQGGITGSDDKRIKVCGDIHAKFILDSNVEAEGSVVVEKEIIQSNLRVRGSVMIPNGRIVGGRIKALGGVDMGKGGSEACTPTTISVGVDFRLKPQLDELEEKTKQLGENLKKIHTIIDPLMKRQKTLSPERREAVTELLNNSYEMEELREEYNKKIECIKEDAKEHEKLEVRIRNRVFPETIIEIKEERHYVKSEFIGPGRAVIGKGRRIEIRASDA